MAIHTSYLKGLETAKESPFLTKSIKCFEPQKEILFNGDGDGSKYLTDSCNFSKKPAEKKYSADEIHSKLKEECSLKTFLFNNKDKENVLRSVKAEDMFPIFEEYYYNNDTDLISDILNCKDIGTNFKVDYVKSYVNELIKQCEESGAYVKDLKEDYETIFNDNNLSISFKKEVIGQLAKTTFFRKAVTEIAQIPEYQEYMATTPANGKIDAEYKQGGAPDCWLIASIKSMTNNPVTKQKLDDLVTTDEEGNVTVKLLGPNKTYLITKEELEGCKELAFGDLDVRAIELAFDKLFKEENLNLNPMQKIIRKYAPNHISPSYTGIRDHGANEMVLAFTILFGEGPLNTTFQRDKVRKPVDASIVEKAKKGDCVITVLTLNDTYEPVSTEGYDENGNQVEVPSNHRLTVIKADDEFVYYTNPSFGDKLYHLSHEEFIKGFDYCYEYTL